MSVTSAPGNAPEDQPPSRPSTAAIVFVTAVGGPSVVALISTGQAGWAAAVGGLAGTVLAAEHFWTRRRR